MKYMLLLYSEEGVWEQMSPEEQMEIYNAHGAFSDELRRQGKMVGGDALQPSSTATTVRIHNGQTLTSDGPFAETKEQLGGFYIINADNLDEAIEWASKIPDAGHTIVEIRPVLEFDD